MRYYAKAIIALLGALATWGITAAEDNMYTQVEMWGAILAVSTAITVYLVPNKAPRTDPLTNEMFERGQVDAGAAIWFVLGVVLGIVLCKLV